jgi:hypothetical protein
MYIRPALSLRSPKALKEIDFYTACGSPALLHPRRLGCFVVVFRSFPSPDIQPCPVSGKDPHIRRFLNDLVGGLAYSMSRARLNAGQIRLVTNLRCLKRGDIFEGVAWHYAIVRVGSGGKDSGIVFAGLDVVIRRIF